MKVGVSLYLGRNLLTSRLRLQAYHCLDGDCGDFLPWLRKKARTEISAFLSIGKSSYGRCLIASEFIHTGDSILEVPYSVQLAPDNLPSQISSFLDNDVGDIAKLALVILIEQKLDQDSEWAPYISRLPRIGSMNSTIFWSDDELEMIRVSYVYHETIKQRAQVEKDYFSIKHALQHIPEIFEDVTLKEFKHAYGLVTSRAWASTRGVSLIPFADFLNHDCNSDTDVLCDESKQISEVVADCDYTPGDQVFIRYGKFSNATLILDFGFALSSNIYDQVQIDVDIPHHDPLYAVKMDMMRKHFTPAVKDVNEFCSCRNSFIIKILIEPLRSSLLRELKPTSRKGRGIPQSLRAFARVLCSASLQELSYLANEASQTDGRLARQPLKNRTVELQAHEFLLSRINGSIEEYYSAIEPLRASSYPHMNDKVAQKAQLAQHLLGGELRVLQSAAAWLKNYCKTL